MQDSCFSARFKACSCALRKSLVVLSSKEKDSIVTIHKAMKEINGANIVFYIGYSSMRGFAYMTANCKILGYPH